MVMVDKTLCNLLIFIILEFHFFSAKPLNFYTTKNSFNSYLNCIILKALLVLNFCIPNKILIEFQKNALINFDSLVLKLNLDCTILIIRGVIFKIFLPSVSFVSAICLKV